MRSLQELHLEAIEDSKDWIEDSQFNQNLWKVNDTKSASKSAEITLKFAIEQLKLVGNYFDVSKLNVKEHTQHLRFTSIIQDKINALKQQLKELEL
jgi:uncharacterized protein YnzC (UPF0291/DUF896 family)